MNPLEKKDEELKCVYLCVSVYVRLNGHVDEILCFQETFLCKGQNQEGQNVNTSISLPNIKFDIPENFHKRSYSERIHTHTHISFSLVHTTLCWNHMRYNGQNYEGELRKKYKPASSRLYLIHNNHLKGKHWLCHAAISSNYKSQEDSANIWKQNKNQHMLNQ